MATATSQPNVVHLLEDVMTAKEGMYLSEREVRSEEMKKSPKNLEGIIVIGIVREKRILAMNELDGIKLKEGDHLLFMERK
jgi:voltage-gated potassium channel